ncbi:hypothetical protein A5880_002884 [Enterococcus sp. 4G2_DIV0659]|uniref:Uncharacterized protein n=1 Tax=Candidatus Enterococcus mansonii TaxID=1834181 RepID=A0ABU8III8_9ENTE
MARDLEENLYNIKMKAERIRALEFIEVDTIENSV